MVYGFSPHGPRGHLVRVDVDVRRGLPGTDIIGLASNEVRECRERVRVAIRNSGLVYPLDRVLVSLSPAEVPKIGAGFDLPVALAILEATGQISLAGPLLATGELSVRGDVLPVRGVLSAVIAAREQGLAAALIPPSVAQGTPAVRQLGIELQTGATLQELVLHGPQPVLPTVSMETLPPSTSSPGFDDVRGQYRVKRAALISAAGGHNLLLAGPPGSGKTMVARRIPSIMPQLTGREALEVARTHSLRGLDLHRDSWHRPPLRMPHHSVTAEGVLGGGRNLLPGEASLAHHGVLVLDEATEFRPHVLQSLREPVEERRVTIARAGQIEQFPSSFIMVLTSNLCPCGSLGTPRAMCLCSMQEISRYWRRVGAALLDRIEIRVMTGYTSQPSREKGKSGDVSLTANRMEELVQHAMARQMRRNAPAGMCRNGHVSAGYAEACLPLSKEMRGLLQELMQTNGLSDRAAHAVRAVAWTIADLDDLRDVNEAAVREAVGLRMSGIDSLVGRHNG